MRRPVKPFVTEYKGPNRRPSHPAGASQRMSTEDFPFSQAPHEPFARHNGHNGNHAGEGQQRNAEDAYEAALRAADALFSPVVTKDARLVPASKSAGAMPGFDQPVEADGEVDTVDSSRGGGRILRVIDEPPAPGLDAIEADRAPKRRGRKPGSKNKPKFQPADLSFLEQLQATPVQPAASRSRPAVHPSARAVVVDPADTVPSFATAPERPDKGVAIEARKTAPSDYASRSDERFSWVRTKLAPGEKWKRRLPKVCW